MPITITSSRFGTIEIDEDNVLEFPIGLIGIEGHRYALISHDPDSAFVWLHSLDDHAFAIPVTSPWQFFPDYAVEVADGEAERIGLSDDDDTEVWVTVRASSRPEDCFVNLRAPILVTAGRGFQVINESPGLAVRTPLFGDLERGEQSGDSSPAGSQPINTGTAQVPAA